MTERWKDREILGSPDDPIAQSPVSLTSLNQSLGKLQSPPQACFPLRHFSLIVFMIIPREMQNPVQHKDLNFLPKRMPQGARVTGRNVERDRNIPRKTIVKSGRREPQHVRGLVLTAETRLQRTHLAAVRHH